MTLLLVLTLAQDPPRDVVRRVLEIQEPVLTLGKKMPVRISLENASEMEARIDEPDSYLEGFEIVEDAAGKVLKAVGKTKGIAKRTLPVEPGGFIGRTVDVSTLFSAVPPEHEGWYRVTWSFGEGRSNEARVLVLRDWLATIETNHGGITLEFLPKLAPQHVLHFQRLMRTGFYEGSLFHRVIPGFMMQGGTPKDAAREIKTPLRGEFSAAKHLFGTVSTARTGDPNSATSQFFICFDRVAHLDSQYTIFGQVVQGEEVVKAIEGVKSDHTPCRQCGLAAPRRGTTPCCGKHHADRPELDVVMKKITLTERKS